MQFIYWLVGALGIFCACEKAEHRPETDPFQVTVSAPEPVSKTVTKKVYVHLMPWFESKESSDNGKWGIHWTMAKRNPEVVDAQGRRQIASHFYPLTGPYASGDPDLIEYQLLLMKLSGIDGVLIDWPGILPVHDYPLLVRNTEKLISQLDKVGLTFAVVYEDQNINIAYKAGKITDKLAAARSDMQYLESHYFTQAGYIRENGKPLLLVFGPQTFMTEAEWTGVFEPLRTKPAFFTLWNVSEQAGSNAAGEFAWVYQNHLDDLNKFYTKPFAKTRMASAYPGFVGYYAEGGWGGPTFQIPHQQGETFKQTLQLALNTPFPSVQLVTWNDYGEGTMLEPTQETGYHYLVTLQQSLGVRYGQPELELVKKHFDLRKKYKNDVAKQKQLDQVFYDLVSLKLDEARELVAKVE